MQTLDKKGEGPEVAKKFPMGQHPMTPGFLSQEYPMVNRGLSQFVDVDAVAEQPSSEVPVTDVIIMVESCLHLKGLEQRPDESDQECADRVNGVHSLVTSLLAEVLTYSLDPANQQFFSTEHVGKILDAAREVYEARREEEVELISRNPEYPGSREEAEIGPKKTKERRREHGKWSREYDDFRKESVARLANQVGIRIEQAD
jgi:hypothetical protein